MSTNKIHWLILFVILFTVISAWLSFPIFFEWLITKHFLIDPEKYGQKFGAVGDTYGSLNTLISSIALCAVAFSTYLQITSLNEARKDNKMQLELAEKSHDEQVKESRNAIFANKFYSLLNFKEDKLRSITLRRVVTDEDGFDECIDVTAYFAFQEISQKFHNILIDNSEEFNSLERKELEAEFFYIVHHELNFLSLSFLISYFYIYIDFINLLKTSKLDEEDKVFYKSVLANSLSQHEQIVLFWIAPIFEAIQLEDSEIFSMFTPIDALKPYAIKFHKESHFKYDDWKKIFYN